jgi:hypothetical protein
MVEGQKNKTFEGMGALVRRIKAPEGVTITGDQGLHSEEFEQLKTLGFDKIVKVKNKVKKEKDLNLSKISISTLISDHENIFLKVSPDRINPKYLKSKNLKTISGKILGKKREKWLSYKKTAHYESGEMKFEFSQEDKERLFLLRICKLKETMLRNYERFLNSFEELGKSFVDLSQIDDDEIFATYERNIKAIFRKNFEDYYALVYDLEWKARRFENQNGLSDMESRLQEYVNQYTNSFKEIETVQNTLLNRLQQKLKESVASTETLSRVQRWGRAIQRLFIRFLPLRWLKPFYRNQKNSGSASFFTASFEEKSYRQKINALGDRFDNCSRELATKCIRQFPGYQRHRIKKVVVVESSQGYSLRAVPTRF